MIDDEEDEHVADYDDDDDVVSAPFGIYVVLSTCACSCPTRTWCSFVGVSSNIYMDASSPGATFW